MSYIYVVQMDIPAQYEADFNRIYDTEHVPHRRALPRARDNGVASGLGFSCAS